MTHLAHIRQFAKMLRNLDAWMDAAAALAEKKSFGVDVLASARLAPDQFAFVKQVQAACDAAKYAAAYLSGQTAPSHPDTEATIAELKQRIATCTSYLDGFGEADFAGASGRRVSPPWLGGAWLAADEYLLQAAIPNFYFHVVTAYSILRHNGVELGKQGYIGALPVQTG